MREGGLAADLREIPWDTEVPTPEVAGAPGPGVDKAKHEPCKLKMDFGSW